MKSPNANCIFCNAAVYISKYRTKTFKYCSRSCQARASRVQIKKSCEICGIEFAHISSRCNTAKYCSRKCYYKAQHLKGSIEKKCRFCEKIFRCSPSQKRVFCSQACVGKCKRDNWHPNFTTVRKKMIREGKVNECHKCGYNEFKDILGIHHSDGNRENNSIENLMVLCPMCHSLIHRKHICH